MPQLPPSPPGRRLPSWPARLGMLAAAAGAPPAPAQQMLPLAPVVVHAARDEADPLDVPASVDRVQAGDIRGGRAQVNISESLARVPGLVARDRQNHAQDVQISVRGFGARASFGIRGVRLYVDGIPATLPDGQGQISHVDLASAERIEVLRGPFSALYGNAAGGVLQVFTEEGRGAPRLQFTTMAGSDGLLRMAAKASGHSGPEAAGVGYVVSASRFRSDGWRDHGASRRSLGNAKLVLRPHEDGRLTVVANRAVLPLAQDPLGLTRAQAAAAPRAAVEAATAFDTRKTMDQTQAGLLYEHHASEAHAWQAMFYLGRRGTGQFQAIPVAVQAPPAHPGGVIGLDRDYQGLDLRWTWRTRLADAPLALSAGLAWDGLREQRRGWQNFDGALLGVAGALRRDERNRVQAFDQYLQLQWQPRAAWTLQAGLRASHVRLDSRDAYVTAGNPDDSGSAHYAAVLPVLGVAWRVLPGLALHVAAGEGFETPTLNELAYRPGGATGLNQDLRPARSRSLELGAKADTAVGHWSVALFRTATRDEITTLASSGGRAVFHNAGRTRRQGLELAWSAEFARHGRWQLAHTALDARYRDGTVAGHRMPGLPRQQLYAGLHWQPPTGWRAGAEWRVLGRVAVDDAGSDAAAGHALASAFVGYAATLGPWALEGFVRADNLFDRATIGSVIVNEANGRFFEPAPGRTWLAGLAATLRF